MSDKPSITITLTGFAAADVIETIARGYWFGSDGDTTSAHRQIAEMIEDKVEAAVRELLTNTVENLAEQKLRAFCEEGWDATNDRGVTQRHTLSSLIVQHLKSTSWSGGSRLETLLRDVVREKSREVLEPMVTEIKAQMRRMLDADTLQKIREVVR